MWDKIGEIARLLLPRITMDAAPWVHAAMQSGYPAQLGGSGGGGEEGSGVDSGSAPGAADSTATAPRNKQRNEPGAGGFDANAPSPGGQRGGFDKLSAPSLRPPTDGGRGNVAPSNI